MKYNSRCGTTKFVKSTATDVLVDRGASVAHLL